MKNKRQVFTSGISLCLLLCFSVIISAYFVKPVKEYGVFLGIGGEQIERLRDYRTVVIEPSKFQSEQIEKLHRDGKKVYGYINIGAVETYRPYYKRFSNNTLGVYEDWPDEKWVDVSSSDWQSFITDELGRKYADMGFDGFFLDNADVYYHYPSENIFQGLCSVLKGLKTYKLPLIINGADAFVSRCMEENTALSLFDGINQETVFTSINFADKSYGKQPEEERRYFQEYLAEVKKSGLSVYLLEYGAAPALAKEIDSYCSENGFFWYNAEGLELR